MTEGSIPKFFSRCLIPSVPTCNIKNLVEMTPIYLPVEDNWTSCHYTWAWIEESDLEIANLFLINFEEIYGESERIRKTKVASPSPDLTEFQYLSRYQMEMNIEDKILIFHIYLHDRTIEVQKYNGTTIEMCRYIRELPVGYMKHFFNENGMYQGPFELKKSIQLGSYAKDLNNLISVTSLQIDCKNLVSLGNLRFVTDTLRFINLEFEPKIVSMRSIERAGKIILKGDIFLTDIYLIDKDTYMEIQDKFISSLSIRMTVQEYMNKIKNAQEIPIEEIPITMHMKKDFPLISYILNQRLKGESVYE